MGAGIPRWNRDVGHELFQAQLQMEQQRLMNQQMQNYGLGMQNQNPFAPPPPIPQQPQVPAPQPKKEKSMFKEISTDIKAFIMEHRGVIYFIAFALIVDHFVFRGAFKARLQGMADRIVTKVEEKIQ